jgi:hypothetical protein
MNQVSLAVRFLSVSLYPVKTFFVAECVQIDAQFLKLYETEVENFASCSHAFKF